MSTRNISLSDHHEGLISQFKQDFGISASDAIRRGLELLLVELKRNQVFTEPIEDISTIEARSPFVFMGHLKGNFYYKIKSSQELTVLSWDQHKKEYLLMLAPVEYWENSWPRAGGANWIACANVMRYHQTRVGEYNPPLTDSVISDLPTV